MSTFDREYLIKLLTNLEHSNDPSVREIHTYITSIKMSWEQLLVSEYNDPTEKQQSLYSKEPNNQVVPKRLLKEDTVLIKKLLKEKVSNPDTREELERLLEDIKEGIFVMQDHQYLHTLKTRLEQKKTDLHSESKK